MLDKPLDCVLKRLCREEANGNKKINQKKISFPITKNLHTFQATKEEFLKHIIKMCGTDMFQYIAKKKEQLEKNGQKYHTLQFKAKIDPKTFVDFMLGLKGPLDVKNVRSHRVRYGISIPAFIESTEGKISIQPNPYCNGKLIVRGKDDGFPATANVQLFLPPFITLPKEYYKFLLKSDFITIQVIRDGNERYNNITISTNDGFIKKRQTVDQWKNLWQILARLQVAGTSFEFLPDKNATIRPFRFPCSLSSEIIEDDGNIGIYIDLCKKVGYILDRIGGFDDLQLSMSSLSENGNPLYWLYAVLSNEATETTLNFTTPFEEQFSSIDSQQAVLLGCISIDELNILYSVKVSINTSVDSDKIIWTCLNPEPLKIRGVLNNPIEFAFFSKNQKTEFPEIPFIISCDERFDEPAPD